MLEITEDQISEVKAKLGAANLYDGKDFLKITVDASAEGDGSDPVIGYLCKPTRPVLGAMLSKIAKDPAGAWDIALKNCLVKEISDPRFVDDDMVFISSMQFAENVLNIRKADLKKI